MQHKYRDWMSAISHTVSDFITHYIYGKAKYKTSFNIVIYPLFSANELMRIYSFRHLHHPQKSYGSHVEIWLPWQMQQLVMQYTHLPSLLKSCHLLHRLFSPKSAQIAQG